MSDPIRSISQNNYLLAAQQEVSHDNTLSGNGTEASPLGLNETVLYSASGQPEALATWNLSDNPNNFEKLEITYQTYFEGLYGNKIGICPCINGCYSLDNVFYNSVGNNYYLMFWELSSTNNQMNLISGGFRQINSSSTTVTNQTTLRIYKIVGINRKTSA